MPTLTPAEFAKLDAKTIQFGLPATGIHKTDAKGKVETKDWIFLNLKRPLDFLLGKGKAWVNSADRFANNAPLPSDRTNLSVLLVEDPEHPTDQERQTVQAFERIMRGAVDFVDSQPSLSTGWAKQGWNKPALVEARMNARALYYGEKDATDLVPNKSPTVEIRFSVNKKTKEVLTPIQKVSADDSSSGGTMTPFLHADLMDLKTVDVAGIVSLESVMVGPKNKCVYLRFVFKEMCIWVPKSREEREAEDRVYSSNLLEQMVRSEYIQVAPPWRPRLASGRVQRTRLRAMRRPPSERRVKKPSRRAGRATKWRKREMKGRKREMKERKREMKERRRRKMRRRG